MLGQAQLCVGVCVCGVSSNSQGQSRAGEPGINSSSCMSDLRKHCVCLFVSVCVSALQQAAVKRGGGAK